MARIVRTRRLAKLLVFAVLVAATCVALGIWQIARLHQKQQFNAGVRAALAQPPESAALVLSGRVDPDAVRYHIVVAAGTFDTANEIVLYGRTLGGRTGSHLLTPLVPAHGPAIIVDRGWVPLSLVTPGAAAATPPSGTVNVVGVLLRSEGGVPGAVGDAAAPVTTIAKIDLGRIQSQLPYRIAPVYLLLRSQTPAQTGALPMPSPLEPLTNGPHLGYAIQWFTFATIALVGFVVLALREKDPSATPNEPGPSPTI